MLKINRLRLEVKTFDTNNSKLFGFDIPFKNGLNIIAGQNSKGKSTISSCIYYALCMEELLGRQNEKALGKALNTEFNTGNKESKIYKHSIANSKVFIEIENSKGEKYTIRRFINSGEKDKRGDDLKSKKVLVYKSTYDGISPETTQIPLFIRNDNNNENDFGFYFWLSRFIGIELPEVTNQGKTTDKSPLYLQSIFPALFIEQTKGWSEFLATCPYFGIQKNKEKSIEFILDLNELSISSEKERITKEEKKLKDNWGQIVSQLDVLASEYHGELKSVPTDMTSDLEFTKVCSIEIKNEKDLSKSNSVSTLKEAYKSQIEENKQRPIKRVGENKINIRQKLEELYSEQVSFSQKIDDFNLSLNIQIRQETTLSKQLGNVLKELSDLKGIKNIFDEALVKKDVYRKCPTCTQTVSDDLMGSEGVVIEKLSVDENIKYLDGQKKIIEGALKSLLKIIDEKKIIKKYYLKKQRELEEEIKMILQELITDDRDYSQTDVLGRVRLENEISNLDYIENRFEEHIESLKSISAKYDKLLSAKDKLESNSEEDKIKLKSFETMFKNDFLFDFEYDSNNKWNIFIQQQDPFKYFPVFKYKSEDPVPKSIRTNSSASDFVRTLWAYSLTLLQQGVNHPGVLIFDEPGQHAIKSSSLKILFEKASKITDKQIIIFTSVEKDLATIDDEIDKLDIDVILSDLKKDTDYSFYRIPKRRKCIAELD